MRKSKFLDGEYSDLRNCTEFLICRLNEREIYMERRMEPNREGNNIPSIKVKSNIKKQLKDTKIKALNGQEKSH